MRCAGPPHGGVRTVQLLQVTLEALVTCLKFTPEPGCRDVPATVVDRLDPGAIHGQEFTAIQVEPVAEQHELPEHLPEGCPVRPPKVGNRPEVRTQPPQQPDDLRIAVRFRFQSAAGTEPVRTAAEIQLQKVGRVMARPTGRLRPNPFETCRGQIEIVDKRVDEADGVVRANVVVHGLRKQQELGTNITGNMCHGRVCHFAGSSRILLDGFSHSLDGFFGLAGKSDKKMHYGGREPASMSVANC